MTEQTILDRIIAHKREEVREREQRRPLDELRRQAENSPLPRSFAAALRQPERLALIAEVKKASPSKGVLVENFDPVQIARTYAENGAAAISVLTDERFFQGHLDYLGQIKAALGDACPPLLRKDFIVDAYQVLEARAAGADALLLIVGALDDAALAELLALTECWDMTALVEVHDAEELRRALAVGANVIGINNRDLRTFHVDLETTRRLTEQLPAGHSATIVAESGIFTENDLVKLRSWGANAILVGEALVTAPDIANAVRTLASLNHPQRH